MNFFLFYTLRGFFFAASDLSLSRIARYVPSLRGEIS